MWIKIQIGNQTWPTVRTKLWLGMSIWFVGHKKLWTFGQTVVKFLKWNELVGFYLFKTKQYKDVYMPNNLQNVILLKRDFFLEYPKYEVLYQNASFPSPKYLRLSCTNCRISCIQVYTETQNLSPKISNWRRNMGGLLSPTANKNDEVLPIPIHFSRRGHAGVILRLMDHFHRLSVREKISSLGHVTSLNIFVEKMKIKQGWIRTSCWNITGTQWIQ